MYLFVFFHWNKLFLIFNSHCLYLLANHSHFRGWKTTPVAIVSSGTWLEEAHDSFWHLLKGKGFQSHRYLTNRNVALCCSNCHCETQAALNILTSFILKVSSTSLHSFRKWPHVSFIKTRLNEATHVPFCDFSLKVLYVLISNIFGHMKPIVS